jgi:lysophospholipase L1-like esterase
MIMPTIFFNQNIRTSLIVIFVTFMYTFVVIALPIVYSANLHKTTAPDHLSSQFIHPDVTNSQTYKVAVIGDSTALGQGTGSVQGSFSYQYLNQSNLKNIQYDNYAVSGVRINEVIQTQLSFEPVDLVFVSVGANDVTAFGNRTDFADSVKTLISKLKLLAKKVIWVNIPDFVTVPVLLPPLNLYLSNSAKNFNIAGKSSITNAGFEYINVYDDARRPFQDDPTRLYSEDKYHPSQAGYQIWVELLAKENILP